MSHGITIEFRYIDALGRQRTMQVRGMVANRLGIDDSGSALTYDAEVDDYRKMNVRTAITQELVVVVSDMTEQDAGSLIEMAGSSDVTIEGLGESGIKVFPSVSDGRIVLSSLSPQSMSLLIHYADEDHYISTHIGVGNRIFKEAFSREFT